jgi:isopropylmalate/homocitrate/citramalate synthase
MGRRLDEVHFLDVTNRDGVQTARTGLSKFGKTMINFYLGRLGVAQSEIGFPFLFHEVPYVRANLALAEAGAFGSLRLSGWCRAVTADLEAAVSIAAEARRRTRSLRPAAAAPAGVAATRLTRRG